VSQVALGLLWNLTAAAATADGVAGVTSMAALIEKGVLELAASAGFAYLEHAGIQRAALGLLRQASSTGVAAHVDAVAAERAVHLAAEAMRDHPHHVGVQKSG